MMVWCNIESISLFLIQKYNETWTGTILKPNANLNDLNSWFVLQSKSVIGKFPFTLGHYNLYVRKAGSRRRVSVWFLLWMIAGAANWKLKICIKQGKWGNSDSRPTCIAVNEASDGLGRVTPRSAASTVAGNPHPQVTAPVRNQPTDLDAQCVCQ